MKTFLAPLLLALSIFPPAGASAQTEVPRLYVLQAGSTFDTGCFGPCLCPIMEQPMQGTFRLQKARGMYRAPVSSHLIDIFAPNRILWRSRIVSSAGGCIKPAAPN
jgi:hypothetical protein